MSGEPAIGVPPGYAEHFPEHCISVRGMDDVSSLARRSDGTAAGYFAFSSASAAETCGAAIDVPFSYE